MAGTTTPTVSRDLTTFGARWADAELHGDVPGLEALLTDDFVAVGPRGFLLDKRSWLARYETGALVHDLFTWRTEHLRRHGDGAVLLGVQSQQSVYEGRDVDGHFRATHHLTTAASAVPSATSAAVRPAWRLAALHLSPIEGTPPESLAGGT
ncbi:nuclear transport factor 2 family protein [Streptomyces reniochalinae]|uniref:Nuclear transport factor 2 family protein n=1 Tax=Streptomyces reniochalinae TaxID=2250578 RepID=A0A367EGK0_9ACTN|nr:nuclear transport factor 2 family protein [Streptomyces reniochalinae]RCG17171.1 nuclear transport factor 2 family protein [Streptomyces reniochalinae]